MAGRGGAEHAVNTVSASRPGYVCRLDGGSLSTEGWTYAIEWPVADVGAAVPIMTTCAAVVTEK